MTTIPRYDQHAVPLIQQYESLAFEKVQASLLDLLPAPSATIFVIGAGSGRDATWFAARGNDVVAVEPSDAMRTHARALHPSPRIYWLSRGRGVRTANLSFLNCLCRMLSVHAPQFQ